MKIEGSKRLQSIGSYAFADVDEEVAKLRKQGIKPIDFGVGDPREDTPAIIRQQAKTAIDKRKNAGYPSYIGSIEFREAVAAWVRRRFGIVLKAETEITSTIGSKEGIFNFAEAFVNPADYVLCPTPGYPPYSRGALFAEGKPYFLPLTEENNFYPQLEKIPPQITEKSKILWINYPNNPTAGMATKAFLKEVIDFGHDNSIIIASDESYTEFYYEKEDKPISILELERDGLVVFNSLSKRSFMTTYRVGWAGGDEEIIKNFRKVKTNIDSGTPTFLQDAAIAAYSDEKHVELMRKNYKRKRDCICKALRYIGLEDCIPRATPYIWQKTPKGMGSLEFAKKLLQPQTACVVTPGIWISDTVGSFNPGEGYVRFALVPTMEECKTAAERLKNVEL